MSCFRIILLGCLVGLTTGLLHGQMPSDSIAVSSTDSVRALSGDPFLPGMRASTHWLWDSLRVLPPGSVAGSISDRAIGEPHETPGKDLLFYSLLGMVLLLALFRRTFPKYWTDLFRLFFRTTLRQRQLIDQLQLASLPSLALNAFFFLTLSFYLSLLLTTQGWDPVGDYWLLFGLILIGLVILYLVKLSGIKISAWIFGQRELGEDYAFLVFTVNKVMGLLLLPSVIGMAFAVGWIYDLLFGLSFVLIGGLLVYRGYLTYRVVRRQAALSPFHFLLYWVGFELAPLAILYRILLGFLTK